MGKGRDTVPGEASGAGIALRGVSKTYSVGPTQVITALDDVTLEVEPGRAVALAGPSGSGKSTLLHVLGAMDKPDVGEITCGRFLVSALSRAEQVTYRRTIGFVFQRFHLLPALSVIDNVVAPVLPYKTSFDKYERARSLLDAVGLADREQSLPSRLSGGQQQRVAIARALINNPNVLLADEPTGNIDSQTGGEIMDLLLDLRDGRGMTILVATHDPMVAGRCDRIVRLEDGRISDDIAMNAAAPDEALERISRFDPRG